jgi:hypothetical protein
LHAVRAGTLFLLLRCTTMTSSRMGLASTILLLFDRLALLPKPVLLAVVPWLLHQLVFWSYCLFLTWVDLYKPPFFYKYKIQKAQVDAQKIWICAKRVLFNQFFVMLPVCFALYPQVILCTVHDVELRCSSGRMLWVLTK